MRQRALLLRWSWRDLRRRWLLVAAISLVIALGTGTFAAMMSTSAWRTQSNDASFALLDTHDVRVRLNEGSTVPEDTLSALVGTIPSADQVTGARERLVLPTQVETTDGNLVPGEVVGSAFGATVDGVHVHTGRGLTRADDGRPVGLLDDTFAGENDLAPSGAVRLSGGVEMRYVGTGQSPEYFIITAGQGALPFRGQGAYAVVYTSLHGAQAMLGRPGRVNDVVLTLAAGADRGRIATELEKALQASRPPIGATVTDRGELASYRVLYEDIEGDAKLWRVLGALILLGAAFAALNLTGRVVEAQRHEIGIGMALGVPTRVLALRPLLFAAQIALIGAVLGLLVGWLVGIPLRTVFVDLLPLPIWITDFQVWDFVRAAALGFVLPFAASAWPVWRALRVEPVEAIRLGHLSSAAGRRTRRVPTPPIPGPSYRQAPLRNLMRVPRRTLLTTLGLGAAVATMVGMLGIFDSFSATLDRAEQEMLRVSPDRVTASMPALELAGGRTTSAVRALPSVGRVDTGLLLPVTARHDGTEVELVAEVVSSDAAWSPTVVEGRLGGGLLLAEKAASDLGVGVGDTLTLRHPVVVRGTVQTMETPVPVSGLHPNPMRMLAYTDTASAAMFGFGNLTNLLTLEPAPGSSPEQVRRELMSVPGVGSAQSTRSSVDTVRATLEEFMSILQVAVAVSLLLALLIAFNSSSIAVDERAREHATMLAFGLPLRTVVSLTVAETMLLGVLGTLVGVAGGYAIVSWVVEVTMESTLPEIQVEPGLAAGTLLLAAGLGIGAVSAAPLLMARRLGRMDIPSTLRVVE